MAAGSITALWLALSAGRAEPSVRLDIIRTALTIVVGGGGAAGLLLTARRQRTTELDLAQKDHDSTEARVTELYGKAAEQLGNDKAPVRLAGIFALERLAQTYPQHRRTIVDPLCAYLRMPFDPHGTGAESRQEQQVRESAQQVLTTHLRAEDADSFWADVRLNLTGATLTTFTFIRCCARFATFSGAVFVGPAVFRGSSFDVQGDFRGPHDGIDARSRLGRTDFGGVHGDADHIARRHRPARRDAGASSLAAEHPEPSGHPHPERGTLRRPAQSEPLRFPWSSD
nr:pentapeptide repeat-containing protein [Saccharopolyspora sp. HNM0983]